jgi:hypothetical protein
MRKTPNYSCVVICIKPIDLQQLMVSWRWVDKHIKLL